MLGDWTITLHRDPRADLLYLVHVSDEAMFSGPIFPHHHKVFPKVDPKMKGRPFYISFLRKYDRKQRGLIRKAFPSVAFKGEFAFLTDADVTLIKLAAT